MTLVKPLTQLTPKQELALQVMSGPAGHIMVYGGGRAGKSFVLLFYIISRCLIASNSRHLIARRTYKDIKASIWKDTLPKVLRICFPGIRYETNEADLELTFENGSQLVLRGLDDQERVDKILGTEYSTIFFNEATQLAYATVETVLSRLAQRVTVDQEGHPRFGEEVRTKCFYDLNPTTKRHWAYKLFIDKLRPYSEEMLPDPDLYASFHMTPHDNRANIAANYIATLESGSNKQRARMLEGKFQDDLEGALWHSEVIQTNRVSAAPESLTRIVVAIDPAVSHTKKSDLTGIVVAGQNGVGEDAKFYVLEDYSLGGVGTKVTDWAGVAVRAYEEYSADLIVGEANNGGDMIEAVVRGLSGNVNYKKVTATKGKALRAEPIAALYEQGRVHHVGEFKDLEDQLCTWTPDFDRVSNGSPDRLDALVWALTELSSDRTSNRMGVDDPHMQILRL